MTGTASVQERVEDASSLAELLDAVYDAFGEMLSVIVNYHDSGRPFYAALVMAGAAAADGRDAIAAAPSLPRAASCRGRSGTPDSGTDAVGVAAALAALSDSVAVRLLQAATSADAAEDRAACRDGAAYAHEAHLLMAGKEP